MLNIIQILELKKLKARNDDFQKLTARTHLKL